MPLRAHVGSANGIAQIIPVGAIERPKNADKPRAALLPCSAG